MIKIRNAEFIELPLILDLINKVFSTQTIYERLEKHTLWTNLLLKRVFVAADRSNHIYGMVAVSVWSNVIGYVCVEPEAQNQNIGRNLMKHAESYLRGLGYHESRLYSLPLAYGFYLKQGYHLKKGCHLSRVQMIKSI